MMIMSVVVSMLPPHEAADLRRPSAPNSPDFPDTIPTHKSGNARRRKRPDPPAWQTAGQTSLIAKR
jgi:hypothetical protein